MSTHGSESLRSDLVYLLRESGAHQGFDSVVDGIPFSKTGVRPPGAAHSLWEVVEHMRIIQWDLIESRHAEHVSPVWPVGYWPPSPQPPDEASWNSSVTMFRDDLARLCAIVTTPAVDLFERAAHAKQQTLLQDVLVAADHNSYHYAEMIMLRRLLDCWP